MNRFLLTGIGALCIALVVTGCNVLGPASYLIGGLPKVDAVYTLDPERTTVVFVDDRANRIATNSPGVRRAVAESVTQELITRDLVPIEMMRSPLDAMAAARARDRHQELLPMGEIGRQVNADQIIYIEIVSFQLAADDGVSPRPTAACTVRVLDVVDRKRLFPPPEGTESGRYIMAQGRAVDASMAENTGARMRIFDGLAKTLGRDVAKLFYDHEVRDLGDRLTPG